MAKIYDITDTTGKVVGYRARYLTPDGKSRMKDFKASANKRGLLRLGEAKDAATQFLAEVTVEKATGAFVDPAKARLLYSAWVVDHWWPGRPTKRASTLARDESIVRVHLLPRFGHLRLDQLDHLAVRQWVADLTASGKAPATIGKAHQLLAESLNTAVASQYLKATPCTGVKMPTVQTQEMRFLNPQEIARLVEVMPQQYKALVLVLAYGGLRIGEAAGLRVDRWDPLRRTITVTETLSEVQGRLVPSDLTKTAAGKRKVVLPSAVADALTQHIASQGLLSRSYVFTSPEGGPFRLNSWRRRVWAPALAAAGIEALRVHDLRHTAISIWIATGANLLEISKRAGHTKTTFTLDRYGHLFPDADADLAARLDSIFVASPQEATVVPFKAASE